MRVILASKSPRRDEILTLANIPHEISVSEADETLPVGMAAPDAVAELSRRKAFEVLADLRGEDDFVIVAADTMVEAGGKILGKPKDYDGAKEMLLLLSEGEHFVHTGITVTDGEKTFCECVTTKVTMRKIEDDELEGYIATGAPFDKAGAYGIQGVAGIFVSHLDGDYFNVMGLPLCRVSQILRSFGVTSFDI